MNKKLNKKTLLSWLIQKSSVGMMFLVIMGTCFGETKDQGWMDWFKGKVQDAQETVLQYAAKAAGDSPLHVAAAMNSPERVLYWLNKGVDVNVRGAYNSTPLLLAAAQGYLNVVKQLVEHGANSNAADNLGTTPLIAASYYNHYPVVEYLTEKGAVLDWCDKNGKNALAYAEKNKNAPIRDYLRAKGATLNCIKSEAEVVPAPLPEVAGKTIAK